MLTPPRRFVKLRGIALRFETTEVPKMRSREITTKHRTIRLPESARAALDMLAGVPQIERMILFGSRAIGDHDERSDLDVAVSAPDLDRAGFAALRDRLDRFRTLYTISLTSIESMPPRLRDRVLAQGVVLYDRQEAEG